jgi:hypothetical protein
VALAAELQDEAMVDESVDHRTGSHGVGKYLSPRLLEDCQKQWYVF